MTRGFVVAGTLTLALAAVHADAQTRPDFSGTWVLADAGVSIFCHGSFTATQSADTLSLDFAAGSAASGDTLSPPALSGRRLIYNLNGTDRRETFPVGPRPASAQPGAWIATTAESVSRAAWNGDQLIVVTHRLMKFTWPSNTPPEFDWQQTFRDALSLDANGQLVIDRIAVIDPLPGGTTRRLEVPTTGTCRYRKAH